MTKKLDMTTPPKKTYPISTAVSVAICILTLGMTSCASNQPNRYHSDTLVNSSQPNDRLERTLTSEFVYKYLVAEVAGQRGDIGTAGAIFYDLARAEQDARLAERAAKIGAYANIPNLAIPAVKLWAELDPTSTEAQQAMTEMLIATGRLNEAEPYLAQLLVKEESRAGGFLFINSILNRSTDKNAVLKLVQSLAKPYPTLAEANFAVAQAAYIANQDTIALDALEKAEDARPNWVIAALLKGQVLFRQSPNKAIAFYYEYLKVQPEANEIRINLAKILVNQKQYAAAKAEFPTILAHAKDSQDNNNAEIYAIVGLLSFQATDYDEAENYFKQAIANNFKESDQIYLYLGQTAEKQKHDATAMSWYNKVPAGPRHLEAQFNLANVIARTQSVDKAVELLDNLDDLNVEQQILVIKAQAALLSKEKRHQEAFELLGKAVKNLPNTPELVYDYALAAERVGKFDIMELELRRSIAEKPDFAAAYNALGYSFADRNIRLKEAISLIEKALIISPNDHYMLDSLGWAHYRKGNLDKAIQYLEQAYNINPDPEIAAHLGEVLWQKGEYEKAKKIWSDALTADPENETLLITANKFKS
jgi:tetratricopeptide (TPR) repeat protein